MNVIARLAVARAGSVLALAGLASLVAFHGAGGQRHPVDGGFPDP